MFSTQKCTSGSPSPETKKRLSTAVKRMMGKMGFRLLVMSKGNVVMEGTPKEVFSQTEKVRALRLDVPQAAELRDELVKAGIPMPEGIIDTGACAQALYELLK